MKEFISKSTEETFKIAKKFSRILTNQDVVGLWGKLGSGKTTFIKGIAENLGVDRKEVTSTSFIILKEHQAKIPIYHIDLYRLKSSQIPDEVYEVIFEKRGLILIEWADKIKIPTAHFKIQIEFLDLNSRKIIIDYYDSQLNKRLNKL